MKNRIINLFLLSGLFFLSVCGASAQTTPAPTQHFVVSGSAAGQPAAITTAGVQLTSSVSVVYEYIVNPNDSTKPRYGSGLANYTVGADKFLPKSLKPKLLIDPSNYNVTFQAGAGKESLANPAGGARISHIIGNFGIYGSRPMPSTGSHAQIGLGYKWIVGPGTNVVVKVPVGTLNFTF